MSPASPSPPSPPSPPPPPSPRGGGLFLRIYVTFILTVIAFAAIVGLVVLSLAGQYDAAWVESVDAAVAAREPALSRLVADSGDATSRAALEAEVAALASELDLRAAIHDREGNLLAGDPATRSPRALKPRQLARLQRGQPVVRRGERGERGDRGPALGFGITGADGSVLAVLALAVGDRGADRNRLLVLALLGLLAILAGGAWPLARSLTRRLAVLEESAGRIARGELGHRIPDPRASDELGRLGLAFNDMAAQLEAQVHGQRALLTNVSHELRTPVARMRVLAELLAERLAGMPDLEHPATIRVRRGIAELGDDLIELETLIADLLTSGRLDLGGAATLHRVDTGLAPLLARVAARVAARVRCDEALHLELDPVLIERLLANLLHNARRACPEGQIEVAAEVIGDRLVLAVEDEGPGIAAADRAAIFEPFTRLDAARARDHGGVGLGLYLCRQIAQAHGGTITAEDRRDGARGARFAVVLPRHAPAPTAGLVV